MFPVAQKDGITGPMRLWLRYQRYALLGLLGLSSLAALAVVLDHAWWAWGLTALGTATAGPLIVHIWREYPRKWRATKLATRRIAGGTFSPTSLQGYCGDPCWRIVALEILRRAGMPAAERRRVVAELRAEHEAQSRGLIIIDHQNGTLVRVEGDVTVRTSLPPQAT